MAGCAVASVFGSGDYDRKKKKIGSGNYDRKKKVPVVCLAGCCLAGCAVVVLAITTGKKEIPVVCLAGCQFLVLAITTGKKKFLSSVWRVGSGDVVRK